MKKVMPTYAAYTQEDMDALYGTRPATTTQQPIECPDGYMPYTIEAGDTLRSIATARGITVTELLFYNTSLNPYGYKKGDVICVPDTTNSASAQAGPKVQSVFEAQSAAKERPIVTPRATVPTNPTFPTPTLPVLPTAPEPETTEPETTEPEITFPTPTLPVLPTAPVPEVIQPEITFPTPTLPVLPTAPLPEITFPTPTLPVVPPSAFCNNGNGVLYTVAAGDTLRSIAQKYGITLNALLAANPGQNNNRLVIGQTLCIPFASNSGSGTCDTCCPVGTRSVRIASINFTDYMVDYVISYAALSAANPNTDLDNLVPGRVLCIPPVGSRGNCASGVGTQEILTELTAAQLAEQLHVSFAQLMRYNPTYTPNDFSVGRIICVPPAEY